MTAASAFLLAPTERLVGIRKEKYTKPRGGRDIAYVVCDRLGRLELIGQKLPLLVQAINQHVEAGEPWGDPLRTRLAERPIRGATGSALFPL